MYLTRELKSHVMEVSIHWIWIWIWIWKVLISETFKSAYMIPSLVAIISP